MIRLLEILKYGWVAAAAFGVGAVANAPEESSVPVPHETAAELEKSVFVGSRRSDRSLAESPVPIDDLEAADLSRAQGIGDMDSLLATAILSYNVNTQPTSGITTLVRPANLRGFSSDSTLILVNGKRRHRSSVITFYSAGGILDGGHGPDVASIPSIALKRVEVLRDGGSAQYGSDAVAGIINFVLQDADRGGMVESRWGATYEGDGAAYTVLANAGMPLRRGGEPNGFANFSLEYTEAQSTVEPGSERTLKP